MQPIIDWSSIDFSKKQEWSVNLKADVQLTENLISEFLLTQGCSLAEFLEKEGPICNSQT